MLGSTLLRSPASLSRVLVAPSVGRGGRSERKRPIVVRSQRNYPPFPKPLRPMGRPTLFEQFIDQMPLVDKTKEKLSGLYFLDFYFLLLPKNNMVFYLFYLLCQLGTWKLTRERKARDFDFFITIVQKLERQSGTYICHIKDHKKTAVWIQVVYCH